MINSIAHMQPPEMIADHAGPLTLVAVKERILMYAGLSSEQLGQMMGAGAHKLHSQLSATKTQFFAHEGIVMDERTVPDHGIQQKAAVELIGLAERIGGLKAHESEGHGRATNITLDMSGWSLKPADSTLPKIENRDDFVPLVVIPEESTE